MAAPISLAKNTFYLTAATVFQKVFTAVNQILIIRAYGTEDVGRYYSAVAFTTLLSVAIDLGMASMITKEMARDKEGTTKQLGMILLVRLGLSFFVYGMIVVLAHVVGYSPEIQSIIYLTGIVAALDTMSTFCWAVMRGLHTLKYEAIATMFAVVIQVGLSIAVIVLKLPILYLGFALMTASLSNTLYAFTLVFTKAKVRFTTQLSWDFLKKLLVMAAPFALAAIFSRIYNNIDQSLLGRLADPAYAGWYSAANKLITALQFLPGVLSAATMPAMSTYFAAGKSVADLFERSTRYLLLIVLPTALGTFVLARPIILTFFAEKNLPAVPLLQIQAIGLIFAFLTFPLGALLVAVNRQATNTKILFAGALFNVVGNLILISNFQAVGASITSASTYALIVIAGFALSASYLKGVYSTLLKDFFKIFFASLVMAVAVWFLREQSVFVSIAVGIVVYAVTILAVRAVSLSEFSSMRSSIGQNEIPVSEL